MVPFFIFDIFDEIVAIVYECDIIHLSERKFLIYYFNLFVW